MQKEAFVYFVQQGEAGPIKIGLARNALNRLDQLINNNSCELFVRAIIPGNLTLEDQLQLRFTKHHIRGEWFHPHPEILDYMAALPDVLLKDLKYRRRYKTNRLAFDEARKLWADPDLTSRQARAMLTGWSQRRIRDELGARPISHKSRASADNGRKNRGRTWTPAQWAKAEAIWNNRKLKTWADTETPLKALGLTPHEAWRKFGART